jgi:phosphoribosylaminoimidazole-succinocarboxamide synthase
MEYLMYASEKLYEGKAKVLYATDDPNVLVAYFKDDATAFNAAKRGQIRRKGEINCTIASHLFQLLESKGVPTHFIDAPFPDRMHVKALQIIPLEVVVRNIAAGSLCKQTGIELGTIVDPPLVEFFYKDDEMGDPLLTLDRLALMNLVTSEQIEHLRGRALQIDRILSEFFESCQITLVDFKLEFGLTPEGEIILADEISPDTCRLWDRVETDPNRRILDKDRFRQDLGDVEAAYEQVLARVLTALGVEVPTLEPAPAEGDAAETPETEAKDPEPKEPIVSRVLSALGIDTHPKEDSKPDIEGETAADAEPATSETDGDASE